MRPILRAASAASATSSVPASLRDQQQLPLLSRGSLGIATPAAFGDSGLRTPQVWPPFGQGLPAKDPWTKTGRALALAAGQWVLGGTVPVPVHVSCLARWFVVEAAAGGKHSCAVTLDGEVYAWGRDGHNARLGLGVHSENPRAPRKLQFLHQAIFREDAKWAPTALGVDEMLGLGTVHSLELVARAAAVKTSASASFTQAVSPEEVPEVAEVLRFPANGNGVTRKALATLLELSSALTWANKSLENVRTFCEMDEDGSGEIDEKELRTAFKKLGFNLSRKKVHEIVEKFDTDKNGTISFDEFMLYMLDNQRKQEASQGWLQRLFPALFALFGLGVKTPQVSRAHVAQFVTTLRAHCRRFNVELSDELAERIASRTKQPKLPFGHLNLSEAGLTDGHAFALASTLMELPIIFRLDLRMNRISNDGARALHTLLRWQGHIRQHTDANVCLNSCWRCEVQVAFRDPKKRLSIAARVAACPACQAIVMRPVYFLQQVLIVDPLDADGLMHWAQRDLKVGAFRRLRQRLESLEPMLLDEYERLFWAFHDKAAGRLTADLADFADRVLRIHDKQRAQLEVIAPRVAALRAFAEAALPPARDIYYRTSAGEFHKIARAVGGAFFSSCKAFFHSNAPMLDDDRLLREYASLIEDGKAELPSLASWTLLDADREAISAEMDTLAQQVVEHYVALNARLRVVRLAVGHAYGTVLSHAGTVYTLGYNDSLNAHFNHCIGEKLADFTASRRRMGAERMAEQANRDAAARAALELEAMRVAPKKKHWKPPPTAGSIA